MAEVTLQQIIDKVRGDLEWRGQVDPSRCLGYVVLDRQMGKALLHELEKLKGLE